MDGTTYYEADSSLLFLGKVPCFRKYVIIALPASAARLTSRAVACFFAGCRLHNPLFLLLMVKDKYGVCKFASAQARSLIAYLYSIARGIETRVSAATIHEL